MILQFLFTKIAKTPAKAAATLHKKQNYMFFGSLPRIWVLKFCKCYKKTSISQNKGPNTMKVLFKLPGVSHVDWRTCIKKKLIQPTESQCEGLKVLSTESIYTKWMKRFRKREFRYVQGLGSSRAGYQTQCIDTGTILIRIIHSVLCSPLHSPYGLQWTPPKLLCLERTIYGEFRVRVMVLLRFGVQLTKLLRTYEKVFSNLSKSYWKENQIQNLQQLRQYIVYYPWYGGCTSSGTRS